jgi:hypothetical protein
MYSIEEAEFADDKNFQYYAVYHETSVNSPGIIEKNISADHKDQKAKMDLKDLWVNQGSKVYRVKVDQKGLRDHQG